MVRMNMKEKIKVLWFEVSIPSRYKNEGVPIAGWQDSLENIVHGCDDIELSIAFLSYNNTKHKEIEGVTYYPMSFKYSLIEKIKDQFSWGPYIKHIIEEELKVIDYVKPDIIHIFGSEWPYGAIQQYTNIPCVIHIQGCWISYFNSLYPPKYNGYTVSKAIGFNIRKQWRLFRSYHKDLSRVKMEYQIWKSVKKYMGRTSWDKALVKTLSPDATYYQVEEALRPVFLNSEAVWSMPNDTKMNLISVGCSSYFKGMDMLLKTASVLKKLGVDFTWRIAGQMDPLLKKVIENKEKLKFSECNVEILGYVRAEQLKDLMINSTMYVHTAYIENSPNSICEAQILGMPIVSTHVGGISTLVHDKKGGELIPANEPWQMADAIINLFNNKQNMQAYSTYNLEYANRRHSIENIKKELLACYYDILKIKA